jgi:hypothetical protein
VRQLRSALVGESLPGHARFSERFLNCGVGILPSLEAAATQAGGGPPPGMKLIKKQLQPPVPLQFLTEMEVDTVAAEEEE